MEFIEALLFTRLLGRYLEDDEYQRLQLSLTLDPEAGDVIPGTGGCRKLRWTDRRRGKGKHLLKAAIEEEVHVRSQLRRSRGE